jgi:hypothetical protein
MGKIDFEWTQREFAKRLGLKKYKKYPAGPLRTLLSDPDRMVDLERTRTREEEWEGLYPLRGLRFECGKPQVLVSYLRRAGKLANGAPSNSEKTRRNERRYTPDAWLSWQPPRTSLGSEYSAWTISC